MINLFSKELKEFFLSKKMIFILIVSICFIVGAYYVTSNAKPEEKLPVINIGIVDQDGTTYSNLLVNYFKNNDIFSDYANVVIGEKEAIKEQFYKGEIIAYLVIPSGFIDNIRYLEQTQIEAKISTKDTTTSIIIKNVLESYEKYISAVQLNAVGLYDIMKQTKMSQELIEEANIKISMELIVSALDRSDFFKLQEQEEIPSTPIGIYYLWALLSVGILYLGLLPGFRYIKERRCGTLDRLRIIGNSIQKYIIAQILLFTIFFTTIISAIFLLYGYFNNKAIPLITFLLILSFVSLTNSFGILLATLSNNSKTFLLVGNLCYLFSCILGGIIIPIMFLPENFLVLSRGTMNYWFIKLMINVQHGAPNIEIYKVLSMVVLLSLFFILLAFRVVDSTTKKENGGAYE